MVSAYDRTKPFCTLRDQGAQHVQTEGATALRRTPDSATSATMPAADPAHPFIVIVGPTAGADSVCADLPNTRHAQPGSCPVVGGPCGNTRILLAVPLPLAPYTEPKIEPEIMFGFAAAPSPSMDDAALLSCIAWVAHGFEIVQSIFPDWKFAAADTVVANAMHGALLVGPRHDISSRAGEWLDTLAIFDVELYCDGQLMDRGHASNVLDGPLSAVRHLVELLSCDPDNLPLAAGEIVTSGTLTRALPVKAGETWTTKLNGIGLDGISLRFCF